MTRLLGLDVGERRIGVALGDDATGAVRSLTTLRRATVEHDAERLRRLAAEHGASELVVGLPLALGGAEGAQAEATRAWVTAIEAHLGLPVNWRDERLTSVRAESRLGRVGRGRSGGVPSPARRERYRASVDREAAALIVQDELDARAGCSEMSRDESGVLRAG